MEKVKSWDRTVFANVECEIEVNWTGYYDPGIVNGDPDDCREPEGEDNREIVVIEISGKEINMNAIARSVTEFVLFASKSKLADSTHASTTATVRDMIERELFQPAVEGEEWEHDE